MTEAIRHRIHRTFHSLSVRNFRLYLGGQVVSLVGTWMQSIGQIWLVLKLSDSAIALGLAAAFQFLPVLLFGAWGGLIADRFDKRRVLVATQSAFAALALILGLLTMSGAVRLWMVFGLALAFGFVTVVDNPTRQAFVTEMVGADDVLNAVSLNSAVFTGTRIVGPAVAGLLIATGGLDFCFFVNAASYLAVIAGLVRMRPADLKRRAPEPRRRGQIREGLRYVWSTQELRRPLLLVAVIYALSFNFSVLMPLLARDAFGGGAGAYGSLLSMFGIGSLAGALVMAGRARPTSRLIAWAGAAFGVLVAAAAMAPTLGLDMALWVPTGFACMVLMAATNSILQIRSAAHMRGRVMALYAVVFLGSTPVGSPIAGWMAERFGSRTTLAAGGIAALAASAVALWVLRREVALPNEQTASPMVPPNAIPELSSTEAEPSLSPPSALQEVEALTA